MTTRAGSHVGADDGPSRQDWVLAATGSLIVHGIVMAGLYGVAPPSPKPPPQPVVEIGAPPPPAAAVVAPSLSADRLQPVAPLRPSRRARWRL